MQVAAQPGEKAGLVLAVVQHLQGRGVGVQTVAEGGHFRSHQQEVMACGALPAPCQPGQLGVGQGQKVAPAARVAAPTPGGKGVLGVFHHFHFREAAHLAVIAAVLHIHEPVAASTPEGQGLTVGGVFVGQHIGHTQTRAPECGAQPARVAQPGQQTRQGGQKQGQGINVVRSRQIGFFARSLCAVSGQGGGLVRPGAAVQQGQRKPQTLPQACAFDAGKGQAQQGVAGQFTQAGAARGPGKAAVAFGLGRQPGFAPGGGKDRFQQAGEEPVVEGVPQ